MAETLEGMMGLERLRELAWDVIGVELWDVLPENHAEKWGAKEDRRSLADELRDVAGMIERERALPQGVEWPRFDDGEPVRVGDAFAGFDGNERAVYRIVFGDGFVRIESEDGAAIAIGYGERAKRPADTQERIDSDATKLCYRERTVSVEQIAAEMFFELCLLASLCSLGSARGFVARIHIRRFYELLSSQGVDLTL